MAQRKRTSGKKRSSSKAWDLEAAEREFVRNKEAIDSGRTFRARQSSGWKLGGSPSAAGEIKR